LLFYCFRRRRDKPVETNLDLPSVPAPAAGVLAGDTILAARFPGERLRLIEFGQFGFPTHRAQVQRLRLGLDDVSLAIAFC
jgi:hypothetical protein